VKKKIIKILKSSKTVKINQNKVKIKKKRSKNKNQHKKKKIRIVKMMNLKDFMEEIKIDRL
jgi:hypothetical protein